jgi:hypothetical protein
MQRTLRAIRLLVLCGCPLVNPSLTHADVVLDWNIVTMRTAAAAPFNPPLESRNAAIVHAAMFDAVNSIVREFHHYAVRLRAPAGASPEAAAVAAAHFALVQLYPDQRAALDAAYADSLVVIAGGPGKANGITLGEAVAARILNIRSADGAAAAMTAEYTPGVGPGFWIPTPPAFLPALDPGWGSVRPFLMEDECQFRPGPPPALTSRRYTRDFDEIKEIGSSTSTTRTPKQTGVARLWIATGAQNWNPIARQVAVAHRLTLSQNARAFALLNLAGADAFIAAWDAKFTYNQWRPVTAIRATGSDSDGNPETIEDASWTPLLTTPSFPDYIAGHTTYGGAVAKVLEHVFGKNPGVVMTLTSPTAPGVVQTYTTFKAIAESVVDARVWGGIHWRTSSVRGRIVGEELGRYAAHRFLKRVR